MLTAQQNGPAVADQSSVRRVLFLNRSYWPDSEATGQLLTSLCEGLADQFDVHVLAGLPNATAADESASDHWRRSVVRNGVTIHRVQHLTFPKNRLVLKALNFLSFVRAASRQMAQVPVPDVVIFETDPFLLPFAAARLQKSTGCHMIGYLQDVYPDVAVALGKVRNSWAIRQLRKRLFDIYHRCDRMVVLSSDMRDLLTDGGLNPDRCTIIPNWVDTNSITPITSENKFRQRHSLHDKFVVMYSGNLGLTQRLEDFVNAAALLKDDARIQFVFAGRGARKAHLERQAQQLELSNILFCDYQPLDELAHSLSAADLHLVPLSPELYQCLMPSKLYGVLAAGRPFLTTAPVGSELHRIAHEHEVGFTVPPASPVEIAAAIRTAANQPERLQQYGQNARQLAKDQYSRELAIHRFKEVLGEVVSRQSSVGSGQWIVGSGR